MKASIAATVRDDKSKAAGDLHGLPFMMQKREHSLIKMLKAAVCVLRLRPSPKSKSKPTSIPSKPVPKCFWRSLLASMRPMHFELKSDSLPEPIVDEANMPPVSLKVDTSASPVFSMSSRGSMSDLSQYESPLVELQPLEEICEGVEFWYDSDDGDEDIDIKAEEFIAQFYQQIRLQNLNS